MNIPASLRSLSILALVEGTSLVALLGIAMPLKYFADLPMAVSVVGMAHGLLFLWATATLLFVLSRGYLPPHKGLAVFLASLVPFAGLWSHGMLVRSIQNHGQA
jgi:integral membrane protein